MARETAIILPSEVHGVVQLLRRCPVDVWNKGETWYPSLHQWAQEKAAETGYSVREVADPAERERLWKAAVAAFPPYAEYQTRTERKIPVFVAEP